MAEYSPEPPYIAGTPESAPADVRTMIEDMFKDFVQKAEAIGPTAYRKTGLL